MERIITDSTQYVVFDVETNGLRSSEDDLLSISFYKPDDEKEYNRFLPLELNNRIVTTEINGITEKDLENATPLTQTEFDYIVEEFELEKRKILIYAGKDFDAIFFRHYLKRHQIEGSEKLRFYNFKRQILSSKFSYGNISKDNLCKLFEIEGVEAIHSGSNDCRLEWKLFAKMGGFFYLVTEGYGCDNVFRLNESYIIPVSLLISHPNLGRLLKARPYIECQSTYIKSFEIDAMGVEKFPTNFTGMTIEHLIDSMLGADKQDSHLFLMRNKAKLDFIGMIPNKIQMVPSVFNPDGTITAVKEENKELEKRLNATILTLKGRIQPIVDYIKEEIFRGEHIMSQELVIDSDNNIMALCDLSTQKAVLEIKTNDNDSLAYKEQFFYEAKGRDTFHLRMEWVKERYTDKLIKIVFRFYRVDVHEEIPKASNWTEGKHAERRLERLEEIQELLSASGLEFICFLNSNKSVKLRCKKCTHIWNSGYLTLMKKTPVCPVCKKRLVNVRKCMEKPIKHSSLSKEVKNEIRAKNYYDKILLKSRNEIIAQNYRGSKENIDATCTVCGHQWKTRADHLIDRCWCPICRNAK